MADSVAMLIASQASPIMGAKYISAVALSCLVYDHSLNFDNELRDIWLNFRRGPILKSLFIVGQYCAMVAIGYHAISLGIFDTEMTTQTWVIVASIFCGFSLIGTEGIVIYRLRSLWHFNRPITRAIAAMVTIVSISTAVSISLEAIQIKQFFIAIQGFPGCLFNPSSSKPFTSTLVIGVVFVIWDIFNVFIFTCNSFATPYLCTSDVLKRFQKDGGRYFLCLLVIHSLYLFTSAFGQSSRLSIIPLVTALTAVINARIFHGIALEAERYADEYDVAFPKIIS